jgi:hypothetical protein
MYIPAIPVYPVVRLLYFSSVICWLRASKSGRFNGGNKEFARDVGCNVDAHVYETLFFDLPLTRRPVWSIRSRTTEKGLRFFRKIRVDAEFP